MNNSLVINSLRIQRGLKQKDIYEAIGMDGSQYSKFEKGERNLTLQQLVDLSKFLKVSLDFLVFGKESEYITKTSPNSKEMEDVKKAEINNEDVISLLKDIKSEQKRGFANLQSILSIHASVEETPLDALPYDELVKKAEKRRAELQSGKAEIKNKPLPQKAHK